MKNRNYWKTSLENVLEKEDVIRSFYFLAMAET